MIPLSVVIVTWNVRDLLARCLASLDAHLAVDHEVIVVDNASTDGTAAMVRDGFPAVRLLENSTNAGFPVANNQGFAVARGEWIWMLNPDTELIDDSVNGLFDFVRGMPGDRLVGPRLLNTDGSVQRSAYRFPTPFRTFAEFFHLKPLYMKADYPLARWTGPHAVDGLSGASIFFPRRLLERLQGLDPALFWMEDVDLCLRASRAGVPSLYYPGAAVMHHVGGSTKKNYDRVFHHQTFSKVVYYRKHHGRAAAAAVWCAGWLHALLKTCYFALFARRDPSRAGKGRAYRNLLSRYLSWRG